MAQIGSVAPIAERLHSTVFIANVLAVWRTSMFLAV
jgi:hypothetical protein